MSIETIRLIRDREKGGMGGGYGGVGNVRLALCSLFIVRSRTEWDN